MAIDSFNNKIDKEDHIDRHEIMSFPCPICHNKTVYDTERDVYRPFEVDYDDLCVCEECGAELLARPQYDGLIKFEVSVEESTDINSSIEDITHTKEFDYVNTITREIDNKVHDVLTSPQFGFADSDIDDYTVVETDVTDGCLKVEVRCELPYESMAELADRLNPIVEKYYKYAYFDMEDVGVMNAYIPISEIQDYIGSSIKYPNGVEVSDIDLHDALNYMYGEDRFENGLGDDYNWTEEEKQKAVDYWIMKTDGVGASKNVEINSSVPEGTIIDEKSEINAGYESWHSDYDRWKTTPPDDDEPLDDSEEQVNVYLDNIISLDEKGVLRFEDELDISDDDLTSVEYDNLQLTYIDSVEDDILDMVMSNIPDQPGKYRIKGDAVLLFKVSGVYMDETYYGDDDQGDHIVDRDYYTDSAEVTFDYRNSYIDNLEITPIY